MGSIQSNTSTPVGNPSSLVEFEDDWFAQGVSRYAYHGKYCKGPKVGEKCVVKLYKEEWCRHLNEFSWKADTRASEKAQEMALLFNIDCPTKKPISFVIPEIYKVDKSAAFNFLWFIPIPRSVKGKFPGTSAFSSEMVPAGASVAIEEYLEGDYVKFNSNSSYVNTEVAAYSPGAYSHYTYHKSKGSLLVSDIQGVRRSSEYKFTDPAIQSTVGDIGHYGATDLGVFGIVKFFQNHICNDLCKRFCKPDLSSLPRDQSAELNRILQAIQTRHSSTYTYELKEAGVPDHRMQLLQNQIPQTIAE